MDMEITLTNKIETHRQPLSSRLDARKRSLRRFLHHITQLAGEGYTTAAFDQGGFDLEYFTANFGPCKSRCQADFTLGRDTLLPEFNGPKHLANAFGADDVG